MMLKAVKENLNQLDNRQIVDTLFSVGKIHKAKISPELAEESRLFPFLYYFVGDFLTEAKERVTKLEASEIAYFLKGVTNLHSVIASDEKLVAKEESFRQALLEHLNQDHTKVGNFDPYTVSKVLRYLLKFNDGSHQAQEIFKSFSLLLA